MEKVKMIVFIIIVVILATNIPVISSILNSNDCSYSNDNGTFTFEEMNSKERNFEMCIYKFSEFKKINNRDTVLYRLCKINYLKFWNWSAYLLDKKYRLPYMDWETIEDRRGPIATKTGFQDF